MFGFQTQSNSYITVLDIGTFKVCGLMAHIMADGQPEIVGVGFAEAKGIKAGAIINLKQATECISAVIGQIEHLSGHTVKKVTVNLSSTHLKSHHLSREVQIPDSRAVTDMDVKNLVDGIVASVPAEEEVVLARPLSYSVDQETGLADPRGLYGHRLKAYVHVVTIPETQLRNLVTVFDGCHVEIDKKVPTPYASALAVLTEEEKDIGATVLDMGAGTSSFAVFMNGWLVHLGLVPQGGNQITRDIAQTLSCATATAERLKTLNGSAFLLPSDELNKLIVPMIGEEAENNKYVPRSELIKIIIIRLEHILEQVGTLLAERESFWVASRRIVLCGGTGSLPSLKEKTEGVLNANVRLGKVEVIKNLPTQFDSYTFITCIGLLKYVLSSRKKQTVGNFKEHEQQKSRLGKVIQWLMK